MTPQEENVRKLHAALHRLCGLPALSATITDLIIWADFLREMKPLEETEGGPFTLADLTAVLSMMAKQKRDGVGWSMRPSKILQHPEQFRDLVLRCRADLKLRKVRLIPPPIQRLPNGITRQLENSEIPENCMPVGEAAAETFAQLRKQAGL